jgi:hypothetical protein
MTVAQHPALLIMTSRFEGDQLDQVWRAEAAGAPLATIDLGPLPSGDAHALAEALIAANTAFAERCVERAAGNPLFLDQLLRHADESQAVAVPGSIQSLVQRSDRGVRSVATDGFLRLVEIIAAQYEGTRPDLAKQRALAAASMMIGALTMSRIATDPKLSSEILSQANRYLAEGTN